MKRSFIPLACFLGLAAAILLQAAPSDGAPLPALTVRGQNYVDPAGNVVKFWGANLVALYPDHTTADALAANLASREINLVRPHHMLRPGKDWNPAMMSGALLTYQGDSRTWDTDALDRFDYLSAALRRNGIYVSMSVHESRNFKEGDVSILKTDEADADAWSAAMKELNGWNWQKGIDVRKSLPTLDERAALLNEEFIRNLLTHVNPYTGGSYAADSQWISLEVVNECSIEYAIICKNRWPAYWQAKLEAKWAEYARANGLPEPGDLYAPAGKTVEVRARFLRKLDADYYDRVCAVVRATGSQVPMMYSNLWRGDNALAMSAEKSDVIEDHAYVDPLVVRGLDDGIAASLRNALAGKPYFIGEFNQAEGEKNIKAQAPFRTMLMLAGAAYGSLHDWSGIEWFAWSHGTPIIGPDGWSTGEKRDASLGNMVSDAAMLDHLRTAGLIFRQGLVAGSTEPITVWTAEPYYTGNYGSLMSGKNKVLPGWQSVHAVRRAYGPEPESQKTADWFSNATGRVMTSDTGEIVKDTERKQLTVAASAAEAFSGYLDGKAQAKLSRLAVAGESGFATVILVAADARSFAQSVRLLISRTGLDAELKENNGPAVSLQLPGEGWKFRVTRPRNAAIDEPVVLSVDTDGRLSLPTTVWHEAELTR
ncbi:MAG: hypothetical protein WC205_00850 [Opitutaceae bacterium]|jgi:hypothetical protein